MKLKFGFLIFSLLLGCKPQKDSLTFRKADVITGKKAFDAADVKNQDAAANTFYSLFKIEFSRKLSDLTESTNNDYIRIPSDRRPYSGFWYPEKTNGTNIVLADGQSPLQKYDRAFNQNQDVAAKWERENHGTSQTATIPGWAGHCNGFSASATRHMEPKDDVTLDGVTFRRADIKALLAEIYMNARFLFLAGNRCSSPSASTIDSRIDPTVMGMCEDINPGTFHILVANWLGRANRPIVLDQTLTEEVWNYPHYGYKYSKVKVTQQQALTAIGATGATYKFNPNATQFYSVTMNLLYADALGSEQVGTDSAPYLQEKSKSYQYILETDDEGMILGGEWALQSQSNHPDFMWTPFDAVDSGGDKSSSNPHIKVDKVLELWRQSIAKYFERQGKNPEQEIKQLEASLLKEPSWDSNWGQFGKFSVKFDGNQRGVGYSGRKIPIEIILKDPSTANQVIAELFLDEAAAGKTEVKEQRLVASVEIAPGTHQLRFKLKQNNTTIEETAVAIYIIP